MVAVVTGDAGACADSEEFCELHATRAVAVMMRLMQLGENLLMPEG